MTFIFKEYTTATKKTKSSTIEYKDCGANVPLDGNVLLDKMTGANIYLIPKASKYELDIKPRMERLAVYLK